jgi:hypothetical protein
MEPDSRIAAAAAAQMGIRMRVVTTSDEVLAPLGVNGVPATVFVDASGTVVRAATGPHSLSSMREQVSALLGR